MVETEITTGYFKNGMSYVRFGNGARNLIIFSGLDMMHEPPTGFRLKMSTSPYMCLTKDYTVYLITRKSGMPLGYSIKNMSDDYATIIKEEFGTAIDIMGISAGGLMAQQFAVDHPDLINNLVLAVSGYRISTEANKTLQGMCNLARKGNRRAVCSRLMGCIFNSGVKRFLYRSLMWLFPSMLFHPETGSSDGVVEMEAVMNFNFKNHLGNIKAPTLLVCGDKDFFIPLSVLKETADGIPNSKLVTYRGLGHELFASTHLADDVLKFLTTDNQL